MAPGESSSTTMANAITPPDKGAELAQLIASASQNYAQKKYDTASELYSQATTLQAEVNGEMDPKNADLLYAYGKCLFQLGVSQSDVLGGKVAGDGKQEDKQKSKKRKREPAPDKSADDSSKSDALVAEKGVEKAVESKDGMKQDETTSEEKDKNQPFFQISGDAEDWDDASDEDDDEQADDGEEEDDLATAYEILDLARVLFEKQVEQQSQDGGDARRPKELLADTHDLQAEISLENERFNDAISDSKASLVLKQELYPPEKGIVAEAHFKLSLALEFASVTVQQDDKDTSKPGGEEAQVDESLRKQAAEEMESAISCTKLRLDKLTQAVSSGGDAQATAKDVAEIKEIISDMEQRLEDLKNPAISVNNPTGPAGAANDENVLGGILGSILGESPAAQKARIDEAAKGANDLSGLVRRKQPKPEQASGAASGSGKRKAGADDGEEDRGKRARTEEK